MWVKLLASKSFPQILLSSLICLQIKDPVMDSKAMADGEPLDGRNLGPLITECSTVSIAQHNLHWSERDIDFY